MCLFMRYNKANERCFSDENIKKYIQRLLYIILVLALPIVFSALIAAVKNPNQWKGHRPDAIVLVCTV